MSHGDDANAPADPPIAAAARLPLKQRLSALFSEYGRIAVITYFALSILTIIGFSVAFGLLGLEEAIERWLGLEPTSSSGVIGVIIAGWIAAKATLPIRILITLGLTPMVAYVVNRRRRTPPAADDSSPPTAG
jgi:hypothetical protein